MTEGLEPIGNIFKKILEKLAKGEGTGDGME